VTDDAWIVVGALCSLAGASLAVRELGSQSSGRGLLVYLVGLAIAGGLGYWIAEDLDQSGPLGLAAGLAMVEAAPWVWRLIQRVTEKRVTR
jgi:hypothetical protein